ncbi:hypothetical protein [Streptomyces fructofermentans]|uniref:hypothetical protein n=1 Tax=Streptomyces fructofermentans TaxID=152141 RepID=UPI0037A9840C
MEVESVLRESDRVSAMEKVRGLADAGDVAGLDKALYHVSVDVGGDWAFDGGQLVQLLRNMPTTKRVSLLTRMTESLEETAVHAPDRCRGLASLIVLVARGLSAEELAPWREPLLDCAAAEMSFWEGWRLTCLVEVERAAGRSLPDAVIATIRRSALTSLDPGELGVLAPTFTQPVLNPGEPWAERVIADLAGSAPAWHALVAHALTASGSRPTGKWQRLGSTLLADAGPVEARRAITSWLAHAGEPRTTPVRSFHRKGTAHFELDPFNAPALRGLAALLALTPAHPQSAATLADLVEAALIRLPGIGLRSPKLASAAVQALTRLGDDDAYTELRRLASAVQYRPTLKAINTALAQRPAPPDRVASDRTCAGPGGI